MGVSGDACIAPGRVRWCIYCTWTWVMHEFAPLGWCMNLHPYFKPLLNTKDGLSLVGWCITCTPTRAIFPPHAMHEFAPGGWRCRSKPIKVGPKGARLRLMPLEVLGSVALIYTYIPFMYICMFLVYMYMWVCARRNTIYTYTVCEVPIHLYEVPPVVLKTLALLPRKAALSESYLVIFRLAREAIFRGLGTKFQFLRPPMCLCSVSCC